MAETALNGNYKIIFTIAESSLLLSSKIELFVTVVTLPSRIDVLPEISVVWGKMSHFFISVVLGISVVVGKMSHS